MMRKVRKVGDDLYMEYEFNPVGREKAMSPYEKYLRKGLQEAIVNARCHDEPVPGELSFTQVLCFILGWQGGTIHQVSKELSVSTDVILNADYETKQWLCRLAQLEAGRQSPDPLGDALNSGYGSYKP